MADFKKLKEKFVEKAKSKFGEKFDYSQGEYQGSRKLLKIICPIHGEFEMLPETHLKSITGCPKCSRELKSQEKLIDGQKRKEMREYRIWKALRTRVSNVNQKSAEHYVLKGIKCCEAWNSFEQFYKDMGPCPEGYSIDRIDSNGDYCPENCRWASAKEQVDNRQEFNHIYTYNGETHVLKDWAKILNINYTTLFHRIFRSGLSFEEAIKEDPYFRLIEYEGEKHTLSEWCKLKNMEYNVVINRIAKHKWSFEEAINIPKGTRRNKNKN